MSVQTTKTDYSYPDGLRFDISTDSGTTWNDVGVMADGVTATFNYDLSEVENGNAADPDAQAKNLSMALAPSALRSWDTEILESLSAGLVTREAVAGTLVEDSEQDVASGAWAFDTFIEFDGQNSDGTQPTINSVKGSVDTSTWVEGTDYNVILADGGWGIAVIDSATVTTEDQIITIDTDYTPAAGSYLYGGTSSKVLEYYQVRLRHYDDDTFNAYDYEMFFPRVRPDAGGLVLTKGGALSGNGQDEWTIALTAELDTGYTDGRQLFRIYQGDAIS